MINNEAKKGIIEHVSIELINTAKKSKNDITLALSPLEIKELLNELVTDQHGMCDFSDITDEEIDDTVNKLNSIPEEYLVFDEICENEQESACEHCPNNFKNGGSGFCHCTLGQIRME